MAGRADKGMGGSAMARDRAPKGWKINLLIPVLGKLRHPKLHSCNVFHSLMKQVNDVGEFIHAVETFLLVTTLVVSDLLLRGEVVRCIKVPI